MTRAPLVLGGTALGLTGVIGYHTASSSTLLAGFPRASAVALTAGSTAPVVPDRSARHRSRRGLEVQYPYGDLQLKVTISGQRITSIGLVDLQVTNPRSARAAREAIPVLEQQTLDTQAAAIDGVSGASYTTEAYERSLQSALDGLGLRRTR